MNINTNTLLNLLLPKLDTASKEKIIKLNNNGEIDLSLLLKDKSTQTILNELFKDLLSGLKSKAKVVTLLQNSKQMFDFKNFSSNIKDLLKQIETNPKLEKQVVILKDFLINIKNLDEKSLKANIANSGIFLESKLLKNNVNITNDIKAVVLQIQELSSETKVDKILTQIEYFQALSYASMSNYTYLPFGWDEIEDGDVQFNCDDKDNFSCHIDLILKKYGELKVMLILDKKNNININMGIKNDKLKQKIQKNLQLLRQGIGKIGLSLQQLNVFDIKSDKNKTYEEKAYATNDNLNFGIDIKA